MPTIGHFHSVKGDRAALAAEFQSDAVELEQRKPPRLARSTLYFGTALIIAAVVWAAASNVDEVVTASGKLITRAPHLVVQPLETSVVRTLDVKVGDIVRKGQILAQLDSTFSQADLGQLESQIAAFDAQINRIEAELSDTSYEPGPKANDEEVLQRRLFAQRKASLEATIANYDEQIARDEGNLASSVIQEKVLASRQDTMLEIEQMRSTLLDRKNGSRLNYLLSKDARLDIETSIAQLRGKQVELQHSIDKGRAERQSTIEEFRRNALEQLVETRGKRTAAAEQLKKAELRHGMVVLTAPADGVVLDIAQRSIGSVVREAETLFVLVPLESELEAEVQVEGKDVGRLKAGQPVRLKLDAFPFQKHGTGTGTVRLISQDSFASSDTTDEQRQTHSQRTVYRVRVDLNDMRLKALPDGFRMLPGMSITAEVKVGSRSVLSYFLYPLTRGLDESIREP
jgi:HlyD family secretion protein